MPPTRTNVSVVPAAGAAVVVLVEVEVLVVGLEVVGTVLDDGTVLVGVVGVGVVGVDDDGGGVDGAGTEMPGGDRVVDVPGSVEVVDVVDVDVDVDAVEDGESVVMSSPPLPVAGGEVSVVNETGIGATVSLLTVDTPAQATAIAAQLATNHNATKPRFLYMGKRCHELPRVDVNGALNQPQTPVAFRYVT